MIYYNKRERDIIKLQYVRKYLNTKNVFSFTFRAVPSFLVCRKDSSYPQKQTSKIC